MTTLPNNEAVFIAYEKLNMICELMKANKVRDYQWERRQLEDAAELLGEWIEEQGAGGER